MLHTPVAVSFFTVQLSRLHHTHHTPSLARTTAMKAHEGPQQPTKANKEGKGPKQRQMRRLGLRYVFDFFFRVLYILTDDFLFYLGPRLYLRSTSTGRVRIDGDHENGPKRRQTRRLGLRCYVFDFF